MVFAQVPATTSGDMVIHSKVREVLLDVIVRQKNHQFARKLKASNFTITEDGVPQKIITFRLVSGKDADPTSAAGKIAPANSSSSTDISPVQEVQEKNFVSIVFEEISPSSRKYARDAALEFLKHDLSSNTFVGVFSLGLESGLYRLQNFSSDRALSVSTVKRAALSNYSSLTASKSKPENTFGFTKNNTLIIDPAKTPDMATADAEAQLGKPAAIIDYRQREVAMYMGGMRTIDALLDLLSFEAQLPGRKTVLYFCEGLNLPPGQRERISEVISSANRANVSFYGIDARGLLVSSANSLARHLSQENVDTSARQLRSSAGIDEVLAKQDDSQMEMGVANTQINLRELSERTGGFAISDTNEIGQQMIQVMEDVRTHYEITYSPTSDVYDGRFRRIHITTTNSKLDVQSRDGYYALPELNGHPLEAFELPALNALAAKSLSVLPLHLAALRFGASDDRIRYEIAFEVEAGTLATKGKPSPAEIRVHTTFLALVRDSQGNVVGKVSRDIDRLVPNDNLEAFRRGRISVTETVELSPGHYTIDGVVMDMEGNRYGIQRVALSVAPAEVVRVSDVVLVRSFQALTSPLDASDPLQFVGGRVTPQLDGKLAAGNVATLFFVLYPHAGILPAVTIAFLRDDEVFAETHPPLSAAGDSSSIPVVVSAKLAPGDYRARITVEDSGHVVTKWIVLTVTP